MIKDLHESDGEKEGHFFFELFGKDVRVIIYDNTPINYAEKCVELANKIPNHTVSSLCEAAIRYCNNFLLCVGEPKVTYTNTKDVLEDIYPSLLIISDEGSNNQPVIHMECGCKWEDEHGLEFVIFNDEVKYMGPFVSVNPFSDFFNHYYDNYA